MSNKKVIFSLILVLVIGILTIIASMIEGNSISTGLILFYIAIMFNFMLDYVNIQVDNFKMLFSGKNELIDAQNSYIKTLETKIKELEK